MIDRHETRFSPLALARHFYGRREGSLAILFAVVLVPIVACAGAAIDYGHALNVRSRMQAFVDDAAMLAAKAPNEPDAQTAVLARLSATPGLRRESAQIVTRLVSFAPGAAEIEATTNVQTAFMKLLGIDHIPLKTMAGARTAGGFFELHIAIDMSSSLGIAANAIERVKLENLTKPYTQTNGFYRDVLPQGCAFACHRREGWEPAGKTVYQMARDAGIILREDELKIQFQGLVDLLLDPSDPSVQAGQRSIGVMGFSNDVRRLIRPTQNKASILASLDSFPDNDRFETDFNHVLHEIPDLMGPQGSGNSAGDAKKMLVVVTDGIDSRDAFYAQAGLNTSKCNAIKASGIEIAIIEIKYPDLTGNTLFDWTVGPVKTQISPALQACASPNWYFLAVDDTQVASQFQELKLRVAAGSRLRIVK